MANLSSYDSVVLFEVPQRNSNQNIDMINQSVQETQNFEQSLIDYVLDNEITSDSNIISYELYLQQTQNTIVQDTNSSAQQDAMIMSVFEQMSNQVTNCNKIDLENKGVNESLTTELKRYKERVKTFEQILNIDLSSREKMIDSQMDDMIRNRNALKQEIDSLIHTLSKQVKEKELSFQMFTCYVDKKYFDIEKKELSLDNDRLLDHIICQDVMNIVMHVDTITVNVLPADNKCLVNDNIEIERFEQENDHLFELLLSQEIVHIYVNSLASRNDCHEMQQGFIDEYNENLMLKAELAKKEHMVEKKFFDEVILICSRHENHNVNLELKLQHQKRDEKLVAVTPLNKNKKVRFAEIATSSSKIKKQTDSHKTQDFNKPVLPSTGMKSSTSASRSQPSGDTKKIKMSQTTSSNQKNRVEDHPKSIKSNSNKKNHVIEPVYNANVKHTMLNENSELICVKCNQCMFDANHDVCFLEFVNDVNVRSKSKSAKDGPSL
ncbi:hypothetical protein Tco_0968328 [Tanacetum coccineum]